MSRMPVDHELDQRSVTELRAEVERLKPLAELGLMAATVAHEVRNPLAGISANAELLRENLEDPDDQESVDIILAEVDRLGKLVKELLQYSRQRKSENHPLDLSLLLDNVTGLLRQDAEQQGVELLFHGEGRAWGDWGLSVQALMNILRNAIQASQAGDVVELAIDRPASLRVTDHGPGIPTEIREHIFDPFVTGKTRGLGLGIPVARRCMLRQEGTIELESTGESGSTFRFTWGLAAP